jgi:thiol-disulfide isomerase/thioredoxin
VSPQAKRSWIAVAVVVVLLGVAFGVNRATEKHQAAASASPSLIAKANLPDCPTPTGDGKVDKGLPALTLPCLGHGPKVDLAKLRGPLVVNIWAGPCSPCKVEAPLIQQFYAAAKGKVGVLGVVDGAYPDTPDDALDASRGLGLHYPSVFDAKGQLVTWTRSAGIPVSLFIDADGKVAYANFGQLKKGDLERLSQKYLGVQVTT